MIKKWEYLWREDEIILVAETPMIKIVPVDLDAVGRQGWELIQIVGSGDQKNYYFKREIECKS